MSKIVLCDDKAQEREKYKEILMELGRKYHCDLEILTYESGSKLLFDLDNQKFHIDVIYLDIHMPSIDGIEVAQRLRASGVTCEIVFLTVSQKHLLPAFDVGAFNYIIKGNCSKQRFEEIFQRVMRKAEEKHQEYICFTGGGKSTNILINNIRYFEVTNRIITVNYDKDSRFDFYSTIGKLESQLVSRGFIRVHRSYLVSITYVEVLLYGKLQLRDGTIIPVGRSYYQNVKDALKARSGLV